MNVSVTISGADRVKAALRALGEQGPKSIGGALWREANRIMNNAKAITPVETGVLRKSGHVQLPNISRSGADVVMGFGGAANAYAIHVHENLNAKHKAPTQAKFLERPLMDAANSMAGRIASELEEDLRRVAG